MIQTIDKTKNDLSLKNIQTQMTAITPDLSVIYSSLINIIEKRYFTLRHFAERTGYLVENNFVQYFTPDFKLKHEYKSDESSLFLIWNKIFVHPDKKDELFSRFEIISINIDHDDILF